jgi:threonine synthase
MAAVHRRREKRKSRTSPAFGVIKKTAPEWARDCADRKCVGMILETAHPAKFGDSVKDVIGREPSLPSDSKRCWGFRSRRKNVDGIRGFRDVCCLAI